MFLTGGAYGFRGRRFRGLPQGIGGVSLEPAPLQSVAADGWQATYDGAPPSTVIESWFNNIEREGFTTAGIATTYNDPIYVTRRVRQAYPNQASFTTDTVALSEHLYADDVIAGVTNNSTAAYLKPIANWALFDRTVVGNSITVEIVAAHYNGRNNSQAACVIARATDGVTTVTGTPVSSTVVSGRSSDQNAVLVLRVTLDIATLNNGPITVNAKVYPWIGNAGAVLDSADQSARREFSPRYFLKDTTRSANPPYAYVTAAGTAGGVWSTNAATAEATPFDTVQNAINAAASQMPAGAYSALVGTGTSRPLDGAIIRVGSGTFSLGSGAASTRPQKLGALIITRDPNVARASSIVSYGTTAGWRARLGVATLESVTTEGAVIFRDISILRTNTQTLQGEAASQLDIIFDDVSYDNGSFSNAIFNQSHGRTYGMAVTNAAASAFSPGTYEWRSHRGLTGAFLGNNVEAYMMLGSRPSNVGTMTRGGRTASGSFIAFNFFASRNNAVRLFEWGTNENVTGLAAIQNVIENIGTVETATNRISGDGESGDVTHLVFIHNTTLGFDGYGRGNLLYNDTLADFRTHTFARLSANIHTQINTKHDIFMTDGAYIQSWEYNNGVGSIGEFVMYRNADNGNVRFGQDYAGLLASVGTSSTVRNDPLFVSYQGTTIGPVAGAGSGDYHLQSSSPAKQRVFVGFLSHDLGGTARPAPVFGTASTYDASGAYTA
jgi:predicted secreted protein